MGASVISSSFFFEKLNIQNLNNIKTTLILSDFNLNSTDVDFIYKFLETCNTNNIALIEA